MKRKIAVFTNGWGSEFVQEVGCGIKAVAEQNNADVFVFVSYASSSLPQHVLENECCIFKLPNLEDFDGAVILAGTFNCDLEKDYLLKELHRTKIPAVTLEGRLEGVDCIGVNDYQGMYDLAEHMLTVHQVKDIVYMGGIENHAGDIVRKQALTDALHKHNMELLEENVLRGQFAAEVATLSMSEWIEKHDRIPEAVICANDIMAMGLCKFFKSMGYRIPEDVKITGYDCLYQAMRHDPQITSVNAEWINMAIRATEKLFRKIDGEQVTAYEEQESRFICGESCGCLLDSHNEGKNIKRLIAQKGYVDGFSCDEHFRHMYLAVRSARSAEDLNAGLSYFFIHANWLEGEKVTFCLHPKFFMEVENMSAIQEDVFPEEMERICHIMGAKKETNCLMSTKRTMFAAANASEAPDVYIYVPLHAGGVTVGYAMLSRGFDLVQNKVLFTWTRHLGQYLEQVHSNLAIKHLTRQLEILSMEDNLTGIYNRNGCEKHIYPNLLEGHERGKRGILLIADVDRLKFVNDNFGHEGGDKALCMCAQVLRECLPYGVRVSRFGGDEFLAAGCLSDEIDMDLLFDDLNAEIERRIEEQQIPFRFSLSIGGVMIEPQDDLDINDAIKVADQRMYRMKEIHHQMMGDR